MAAKEIPVSFEFFKKYTCHERLVEKILQTKAQGNKHTYEALMNCEESKENALRSYYKAFYLNPEIREKYHIPLKPMPKKIKDKLLAIPERGIVAACHKKSANKDDRVNNNSADEIVQEPCSRNKSKGRILKVAEDVLVDDMDHLVVDDNEPLCSPDNSFCSKQTENKEPDLALNSPRNRPNSEKSSDATNSYIIQPGKEVSTVCSSKSGTKTMEGNNDNLNNASKALQQKENAQNTTNINVDYKALIPYIHCCPLTFKEFRQYSNIKEVVREISEKKHFSAHQQRMLQHNSYMVFYLAPEHRNITPLNKIQMLDNCPSDLREKFFDIPKKVELKGQDVDKDHRNTTPVVETTNGNHKHKTTLPVNLNNGREQINIEPAIQTKKSAATHADSNNNAGKQNTKTYSMRYKPPSSFRNHLPQIPEGANVAPFTNFELEPLIEPELKVTTVNKEVSITDVAHTSKTKDAEEWSKKEEAVNCHISASSLTKSATITTVYDIENIDSDNKSNSSFGSVATVIRTTHQNVPNQTIMSNPKTEALKVTLQQQKPITSIQRDTNYARITNENHTESSDSDNKSNSPSGSVKRDTNENLDAPPSKRQKVQHTQETKKKCYKELLPYSHCCPVTFFDFQNYTNVVELFTDYCQRRYNSDNKLNDVLQRAYILYYLAPENRNFKPFSKLKTIEKCPEHLRNKILEIPKTLYLKDTQVVDEIQQEMKKEKLEETATSQMVPQVAVITNDHQPAVAQTNKPKPSIEILENRLLTPITTFTDHFNTPRCSHSECIFHHITYLDFVQQTSVLKIVPQHQQISALQSICKKLIYKIIKEQKCDEKFVIDSALLCKLLKYNKICENCDKEVRTLLNQDTRISGNDSERISDETRNETFNESQNDNDKRTETVPKAVTTEVELRGKTLPEAVTTEVELRSKTVPEHMAAKVEFRSKTVPEVATTEEELKSKTVPTEVELRSKTVPEFLTTEIELRNKTIPTEVDLRSKTVAEHVTTEVELKSKTVSEHMATEVELRSKTVPDQVAAEVELRSKTVSELVAAEEELKSKTVPEIVTTEVVLKSQTVPTQVELRKTVTTQVNLRNKTVAEVVATEGELRNEQTNDKSLTTNQTENITKATQNQPEITEKVQDLLELLKTEKIFKKFCSRLVTKIQHTIADNIDFTADTYKIFMQCNEIPLVQILNDFCVHNEDIVKLFLNEKEICEILQKYYYYKYLTNTQFALKYPVKLKQENTPKEISVETLKDAKTSEALAANNVEQNSRNAEKLNSSKTETAQEENGPNATKSQVKAADNAIEKAKRIFFRSVDRIHTLSYVLCTSFGLKQLILRTVLSLTFEEFQQLTSIYQGKQLYDDKHIAECMYRYVFRTPLVWPTNLFLSLKNLCDFLHTKSIRFKDYSTMLMFISPKLLHWSVLLSCTNILESIQIDYEKRTGKVLDTYDIKNLKQECIEYYDRCWKYEKWMGKLPLVKEEFYKDYLNSSNEGDVTMYDESALQEIREETEEVLSKTISQANNDMDVVASSVQENVPDQTADQSNTNTSQDETAVPKLSSYVNPAPTPAAATMNTLSNARESSEAFQCIMMPNTQQQIDMLPSEEELPKDPINTSDDAIKSNNSSYSVESSDGIISCDEPVIKTEPVSNKLLNNLLFYEDNNCVIQCTPCEEEIVNIDDSYSQTTESLPPSQVQFEDATPKIILSKDLTSGDNSNSLINLEQNIPSSGDSNDANVCTQQFMEQQENVLITSTQLMQLPSFVSLRSSGEMGGGAEQPLEQQQKEEKILDAKSEEKSQTEETLQYIATYLEAQLFPSTLEDRQTYSGNSAAGQAENNILQPEQISITTNESGEIFCSILNLERVEQQQQRQLSDIIITELNPVTLNVINSGPMYNAPQPLKQNCARTYASNKNKKNVAKVRPLKNSDFVPQIQHITRPLATKPVSIAAALTNHKELQTETSNTLLQSSSPQHMINLTPTEINAITTRHLHQYSSPQIELSPQGTSIYISQELNGNSSIFNNSSLLRIVDNNYRQQNITNSAATASTQTQNAATTEYSKNVGDQQQRATSKTNEQSTHRVARSTRSSLTNTPSESNVINTEVSSRRVTRRNSLCQQINDKNFFVRNKEK